MIDELKLLWPEQPRAALDLAIVYSGLGKKEPALDWLEKAAEKEVGDIVAVGQDPHLTALHNEPRFLALVRRVGTPQ